MIVFFADIVALCTGMRAVIMVDYGGKMPELQDRLCTLLKLCRKVSLFQYHTAIFLLHFILLANISVLSFSPMMKQGIPVVSNLVKPELINCQEMVKYDKDSVREIPDSNTCYTAFERGTFL